MAAVMTTLGRALLLAVVTVSALVYPALAATLKPGFTEDDHRLRPCGPHRHGLCARRAPVRLPAGRAVARHQEQPAPADAVRLADRQLVGRARPARRGLRPELPDRTSSCTSTTRRPRRRFTTASAASRPTATSPSPAASWSLLDLPTLSATNHNGGAMHFGLDGKLYIAVGENAVGSNSQTLANPLGKMLRINTDGTIPIEQPVFHPDDGASTARSGRSACATRSRSPSSRRRAACSSTTSGRTRGRRSTKGAAGANYGWPTTEGATTNPAFATPVYSYSHGSGPFQGCAITGGAFYAGPARAVPGRVRRRLFLRRLLHRLDQPARRLQRRLGRQHVRLGDLVARRPGGRTRGQPLLSRARIVGVVVRINFTGSQAPAITQHPANRTVSVGQSASFTVGASARRRCRINGSAMARPSAAPPARPTRCRRRR